MHSPPAPHTTIPVSGVTHHSALDCSCVHRAQPCPVQTWLPPPPPPPPRPPLPSRFRPSPAYPPHLSPPPTPSTAAKAAPTPHPTPPYRRHRHQRPASPHLSILSSPLLSLPPSVPLPHPTPPLGGEDGRRRLCSHQLRVSEPPPLAPLLAPLSLRSSSLTASLPPSSLSACAGLDHTADVQFHSCQPLPIPSRAQHTLTERQGSNLSLALLTSYGLCVGVCVGGSTLSAAFASMVLCMSSFLIDGPLRRHPPSTSRHHPFRLHSHSLPSLLYSFLHEALYLFATTQTLITRCRVRGVTQHHQAWTVEGEWGGEEFDRQRHGCGTEVKAVTYSNMQIYVGGERVGEEEDEEEGEGEGNGGAGEGGREGSGKSPKRVKEAQQPPIGRMMHGADLYVIVDI